MKYSMLIVVQAALALGQAASPDCSSVCGKNEGIQTSCSQPAMKVSEHAACMCTGNTAGELFFPSWKECRTCLGVESSSLYIKALDVASAALCSGTPTASFQPIYASAANSLGLDTDFDNQNQVAPAQTSVIKSAAGSSTSTTGAQPTGTSKTDSSGAVQPIKTDVPKPDTQGTTSGAAKPSTGASTAAGRNGTATSIPGRNSNTTPLTGGAAAQAVSGLLAVSIGAVALML